MSLALRQQVEPLDRGQSPPTFSNTADRRSAEYLRLPSGFQSGHLGRLDSFLGQNGLPAAQAEYGQPCLPAFVTGHPGLAAWLGLILRLNLPGKLNLRRAQFNAPVVM